jgi:hypothetical protein
VQIRIKELNGALSQIDPEDFHTMPTTCLKDENNTETP